MENLITQGEQPILNEALSNNEAELNAAMQDGAGKSQLEGEANTFTQNEGDEVKASEAAGSPFGKFKTAQDLLKAYNSLQAEFTKKCQKLSELTRPNDEQSNGKADDNTLNKTTTKETNGSTMEKLMLLVKSSSEDALKSNSDNNFIKEQLSSDTTTARAENLSNGDFKILSDIILSNPTLRSEVLKGALNGLSEATAPRLISSGKGTTSLTKQPKAYSVTEAGKLALNMFGTK